MTSKLISVENNIVKIEVEIELGRSMLESEEKIQSALNEAGSMVTGEALKCFDTDGSALVYGGVKLTSKGQKPKTYQTPYGEIPKTLSCPEKCRFGKQPPWGPFSWFAK